MEALSLDVGGTHIGCGVVRDRDLLAHAAIPVAGAQSLEALLPFIVTIMNGLLLQTDTHLGACEGLAIGFPGIVDARTGTIQSTLQKYDDARRLDLSAWCRKAFALPLRLENDARLALMGEAYAGAARDFENVAMMTLGTGIGTAVLIRGHLLRGVHAHAGCLGGHIPVNLCGRRCKCGNVGCAEAEASGWALPEIASGFSGFAASSLAKLPVISFRDLFLHAQQGDAVALAIRARCLDVWAANAVALVHAYDPDLLVLGGGIMASADIILSHIQQHLDSHLWPGLRVRVCAAQLGNTAALLGAIPLLIEDHDAKKF